MTKRPMNCCKHCGNTWYPRGKDKSSRCPECGSRDIKIPRTTGLGAVLLLGIIGSILMVGHRDPEHNTNAADATPTSTHQSTQIAQAPNEFYSPPKNEIQTHNSTDQNAIDAANAASNFIQNQTESITQSTAESAPESANDSSHKDSPSSGSSDVQETTEVQK